MKEKAAHKLCKLLLLAATCLVAAALPTHAIVIVGNSQDFNINRSIGPFATFNVAEAGGFTMPGQDYLLTDVRLTLVNYGGPSESVVSIYNDNAGEPGSIYALLTDDPNPILDSLPHEYTFTPSGTVLLTANTSYWLVVASESNTPSVGNFAWRGASAPPTGVATSDGFLVSANGGSTWIPDSFNYLLTINGEVAGVSAVPDAGSTLLLMGIGLIGFGCACRTCARAS